MPTFEYKVKTKDGNVQEGKMEAESRLVLARTLREQGNFVLSAQEIDKNKKQFGGGLMAKLNKVSLKDKIILTNNLSAMISAGLSLSRSLEIISRQSKNPKLKQVLSSLIADVNKGVAFGDALEKFPDVFEKIFISMVRAGEESGKLPDSLKLIQSQLEKSYELRRKIKGAMIYPSVILVLIIAIGILMMIFVVPTLSATFADLGAELPATTRFILGLSDFITTYIWFILGAIVILVLLFIQGLRTSSGKKALSWTVLHLPIFKNISKQANSALTMRTLSSLISSGVSMVQALGITSEVLQNPYYTNVLKTAEKEIQKGTNLATIFNKEEKLYPILVGEMVEVGEETGKLSEMLEKGAIFYEEEVDAVTKNLSTIIEPLLMIVIGIAVGFFAISIIQPLYSIGDFI
ncbi:hypothetical protein CL654_00765 [bacterium]|nr:hypothetical protein [bacterium]|tara:strand:- start:16167 stop:17384 length:1218 start_codon:yes stop_codon:yes gene_type:complete